MQIATFTIGIARERTMMARGTSTAIVTIIDVEVLYESREGYYTHNERRKKERKDKPSSGASNPGLTRDWLASAQSTANKLIIIHLTTYYMKL